MKAEPDAKFTATFRRTDGWVGGDGAFSVALSDTRALWLFSDTWVGCVRDGKRKDVAMVNNTVGVQEGNGADAKLTFAVQKGSNGKPAALFTPPDGKGWFWQFAGHVADDKLHVFLPRFEKTAGGGAFAFKSIDLWLGTVDGPGADPLKWQPKYAKVPFAELTGERKRSFGSAVLTVGDHAYVYGYEEKPTKLFPRAGCSSPASRRTNSRTSTRGASLPTANGKRMRRTRRPRSAAWQPSSRCATCRG